MLDYLQEMDDERDAVVDVFGDECKEVHDERNAGLENRRIVICDTRREHSFCKESYSHLKEKCHA